MAIGQHRWASPFPHKNEIVHGVGKSIIQMLLQAVVNFVVVLASVEY